MSRIFGRRQAFTARPDCVQTRVLFFQIWRHAARAAAQKIPAPGHHCAGERGLRLIKWYERMKRESYWLSRNSVGVGVQVSYTKEEEFFVCDAS